MQVEFEPKPELLKIPPDHQLRIIDGMMKSFDKRLKDVEHRTPINISAEKEKEVGFITIATDDKPSTIVILERHKKQKYESEEKKIEVVQEIIDRLKKADVLVNNENVRKLGIGAETIKDYNEWAHANGEESIGRSTSIPQSKPSKKAKPKKKKAAVVVPMEADEKHVTDNEGGDETEEEKKAPPPAKKTTAAASKSKKRPLPPGKKVIAPQSKRLATRKQQHKRDQEKFGAPNVLEKPEDCHGVIERNQVVEGVVRDLCVE